LVLPVLEPLQFFRLRPDNFPTIRMSQLANVYGAHLNLFSKIMESNSAAQLYQVFQVSASQYWQNHYQFDHASTSRKKSLSRSFIDLIIINTIVPIQFAYAKSQGKENIETGILMLESIKTEQNSTVQKFQSMGVIAESAFESQSLLQLKNEYCCKSRCLECDIGMELLKGNQ
jgi:hypothetical protein